MTNHPAKATSPHPHIELTPATALADEEVHLRVLGLQAAQEIAITAELHDEDARLWQAQAHFRADTDGVVNLATQSPLSGSYEGVDGMGLFWSMTVPEVEPHSVRYSKKTLKPVTITFRVTHEGQQLATATLQRLFRAPDVERIEVRTNGLAGTFFKPLRSGPLYGGHSHGGPHPGLVLFGGSGGGLSETNAALLASRGYATLALAYFAYEDLPKSLLNIPLEYFETAFTWLHAQPDVQADRLGVMGASRGGELALLLGATFPQVKAVVARAPSNVVWEGFGKGVPSGAPAWSHHGVSLPVIQENLSHDLIAAIVNRAPIAATPLYYPALADEAAVEAAAIPVEQSHAALLLISGQDDQMWPSFVMADMAVARLDKHNYQYPYQHLCYPNAGHQISLPYQPKPATSGHHSLTGEWYEYGGTPSGNAFAAADSWRKMLGFLAEHLRQ